jgi:aspartate beta-hydroxylase
MVAARTDTIRLNDLIKSADEAAATGRHAEAARLLALANETAPSHPRVLSALGFHALKTGDFAAARHHFDEAVRAEPTSALPHFHVALACRAQGDLAGEWASLERALALDPRLHPALLQKATLLERQGKTRQAAQVFDAYLRCIPDTMRQASAFRPAIEHAQRVVEADRAALEHLISERLAAEQPAIGAAPGSRAEHCLDILLGRRGVYTSQPTLMLFPHLPAIEFFDRSDFPWLDAFEVATNEIREELVEVLADTEADCEIVPYVDYTDGLPLDQWRSLNRSKQWGAYYLIKNGVRINDHLARCPKTAALLAAAPLADVPGEAPTAFFSLLQPRTRIPPHTGVTNTRVVVHVPLIVPSGCGFRVGAETRSWVPGRAWVFDDTIEHEAWNESDAPRAILLIDAWNPFLTQTERAWVRVATAAVSDYRAH